MLGVGVPAIHCGTQDDGIQWQYKGKDGSNERAEHYLRATSLHHRFDVRQVAWLDFIVHCLADLC